jgi:hypothetical protein
VSTPPAEPTWITGAYQGQTRLCQHAQGVTATLAGTGSFSIEGWQDVSVKNSGSLLYDPLGLTEDCRAVMAFSFPPGPRGRVLSGTLSVPNAWTYIAGKNVAQRDVLVAFRQANWATAPLTSDARSLWMDVQPIDWRQPLVPNPDPDSLCAPTSIVIPPGAMTVTESAVGIMFSSGVMYQPELWIQDWKLPVQYFHFLSWGGSCPGDPPLLRLFVEPGE